MSIITNPSGSIYGVKTTGGPLPGSKYFSDDANQVRNALIILGDQFATGLTQPLLIPTSTSVTASLFGGEMIFGGNTRDGLHIFSPAEGVNIWGPQSDAAICHFISSGSTVTGTYVGIDFHIENSVGSDMYLAGVGVMNKDDTWTELYLKSSVFHNGCVRLSSSNAALSFHSNSLETNATTWIGRANGTAKTFIASNEGVVVTGSSLEITGSGNPGLILTSPVGQRWLVTATNEGSLSLTSL